MNRQRYLKFDIRKAIAMVGFLAQQTRESMYTLMKMVYLADKLHLERYGQFMAGETYSALKQGPVPSCTYNLMKHLRGEAQDMPEADLVFEYLRYGGNHAIEVVRQPELDELSESDLECLTAVVRIHNDVGKWMVRDLSHDLAWRKVWGGVQPGNASKTMPVEEIAAQLKNASDLVRHVGDPFPGRAVMV